ncbi:MAG: hypothetical protein JNN12_16860 [Bacteroidetes Order II. Incertae sedis bacterium]|nr:hypothetical protein [Bacteroidetes Order II. bacterium]
MKIKKCLLAINGCVAVFLLMSKMVLAQEGAAPRHFPYTGKVNALVVLVQTQEDRFEHCAQYTHDEDGVPKYQGVAYVPHCSERKGHKDQWKIGSFQSWTDDPRTEWPLDTLDILPNRRKLPYWAKGGRLIDPPGKRTVTSGSLTDFYHLMSGNRLDFRGVVYPYVYVHRHPQKHYFERPAPFTNGVVKMAHEVITFVGAHPENLPLDHSALWDTYRNGVGADRTPDGKFDMIILVYRFNAFRDVIQGSGISSFGTSGGEDGFAVSPIKLGDLDVVEGYPHGSGVIARGNSHKEALRVIVHEIGHRYYGGHTNSAFDVMGYGSYAFYGAGNRLQLGWVQADTLDLATMRQRGVNVMRLGLAGVRTNKVLRIIDGMPRCGDLIVEARFWDNFFDQPSNGLNADGDGGDASLPQEGLYLHKAAGNNCGGAPFMSLENTGWDVHHKQLFVEGVKGALARPAFVSDKVYSPFSAMRFPFHRNPEMDKNLGIAHIKRFGNTFRFSVYSDYLRYQSAFEKPLTSPLAFDGDAVGRNDSAFWLLGGRFLLKDNLVFASPARFGFLPGAKIRFKQGGLLEMGCLSAEGMPVKQVIRAFGLTWSQLKPYFEGKCRP